MSASRPGPAMFRSATPISSEAIGMRDSILRIWLWRLVTKASTSAHSSSSPPPTTTPGPRVGLGLDETTQADPFDTGDQDPDRAVGELQHPLDDGGRANGAQVAL